MTPADSPFSPLIRWNRPFVRLFDSLSTGLTDARAILSRGVGAVWSRRPGNLKADEIAEQDWLQENSGDAQLFGESDEPPAALTAEEYQRAAMAAAEDWSNDSLGVLAIHNLAKSYKTRKVVEDVSLHVRRGEAVGLLGPNGAGKTTALRILTTLSIPDAGTARVAGHDVVSEAAAVQRNIGVTAQDATLDEVLTGRENLTMIGRLSGLSRAGARSRTDELLAQFDLVDAAARILKEYSGGMRRRLDLAAGLVTQPPVLFLDEPRMRLGGI